MLDDHSGWHHVVHGGVTKDGKKAKSTPGYKTRMKEAEKCHARVSLLSHSKHYSQKDNVWPKRALLFSCEIKWMPTTVKMYFGLL